MPAILVVFVSMFSLNSALAADEYITLYGPVQTYSPMSGAKTQTASFNATTSSSLPGELWITNGSGGDLSKKTCSDLGFIARIICEATNIYNTALQAAERLTSVEISLSTLLVRQQH